MNIKELAKEYLKTYALELKNTIEPKKTVTLEKINMLLIDLLNNKKIGINNKGQLSKQINQGTGFQAFAELVDGLTRKPDRDRKKPRDEGFKNGEENYDPRYFRRQIERQDDITPPPELN